MPKKNFQQFALLCLLIFTISVSYSQGVQREIIWSDYPYPISDSLAIKVKFGHIVVPETRDSINKRQLKIAFCVLKGSQQEGIKNPIIMLPGGPGGEMIGDAPGILESPNYKNNRLENHDVVLFDPRGCGQSEPDLCPEMDLPGSTYQNFSGKTHKEMEAERIAILEKCLDSLALEKVDLNAYGSDEIARDIEDLRVSLEVEQWNIMGGSYGTRYGQAVLRNFPKSVRCAVFGGLVPTKMNYSDDNLRSFSRSLELILNRCSTNENCSEEYGDLENKLFLGLKSYNDNPLQIPPENQKVFKDKNAVVTGDLIATGLFTLLYGQKGIEIVPKVIEAISLRKDWVVENFVNALADSFSESESDMFLFIRLNDNPDHGIDLSSRQYDDFTGKLSHFYDHPELLPEVEFAEIAGIKVDTLQDIPIESDVPVLLYSGELDHITPPGNARIASQYLVNSTLMVFPGNGHWLNGPECFSEMITAFYKNPVLPENFEDCIAETPVLELVSGISYNKGISQTGSKILMGRELEVYIPFGIGLLLVLIGFFGYPIRSVAQWFKRKRNKQRDKMELNWLPWFMVTVVIVFLILLALAIKFSLERNEYILGFGILATWDWIFWLVPLILWLLIICIVKRKKIFSKHMGKIFKSVSLISIFGPVYILALLFIWGFIWPFANA